MEFSTRAALPTIIPTMATYRHWTRLANRSGAMSSNLMELVTFDCSRATQMERPTPSGLAAMSHRDFTDLRQVLRKEYLLISLSPCHQKPRTVPQLNSFCFTSRTQIMK